MKYRVDMLIADELARIVRYYFEKYPTGVRRGPYLPLISPSSNLVGATKAQVMAAVSSVAMDLEPFWVNCGGIAIAGHRDKISMKVERSRAIVHLHDQLVEALSSVLKLPVDLVRFNAEGTDLGYMPTIPLIEQIGPGGATDLLRKFRGFGVNIRIQCHTIELMRWDKKLGVYRLIGRYALSRGTS